jgi:FkbM family methyltransferase
MIGLFLDGDETGPLNSHFKVRSAHFMQANREPLLDNSNLRLKTCKHGVMMFHANDRYIGRSLDMYGEFSELEIALFKQFVRPGMTIIDVGANIGAHTIYFAGAVGPTGRVIAFEPQRVLYQMLCGNVALNLHNNVVAVHSGLGAISGNIRVPLIDYSRGGNFGGVELGQSENGERVPLQRLDSCGLKSCHFIKIDVEGMEKAVLEGSKSILDEHQPVLYVENDRGEKSAELIEWLLTNGYRLYWHLPRLFNPENYFGETENVFGDTMSINMLCIPRSKAIVAEKFREITSPQDSWRVRS